MLNFFVAYVVISLLTAWVMKRIFEVSEPLG